MRIELNLSFTLNIQDARLKKIAIRIEATKQSKRNSERDNRTGQVRPYEAMNTLIDAAIREHPPCLDYITTLARPVQSRHHWMRRCACSRCCMRD